MVSNSCQVKHLFLICISLLLTRSTPGNRVNLSVVLGVTFLNRNMFPQTKRHLPGSHLQDYIGEIISYYIVYNTGYKLYLKVTEKSISIKGLNVNRIIQVQIIQAAV